MEQLRFDGRVAVVTGAGRGLGRAHALLLASRGAQVVVNDLGSELTGTGSDPSPAEEVVSEIRAAGGQAAASAASVAEEEGAASIVATALERFGRIDVVVNNAGILTFDRFPEMPLEVLMRHVSVHVAGTFNVTRAAWPQMIERGYGRVVVTTSSAMFGSPPLIGYSTCKAALVGLGRSLAQAGAPHGIRVNLLAPNAQTRMVTDPQLRAEAGLPSIDPAAAPDESRGAAEVSPTAVVLAHERCPVNGETISAGGGRMARIYLAETAGVVAPGISAEDVLTRWDQVVELGDPVIPASTSEYIAHREARISAG